MAAGNLSAEQMSNRIEQLRTEFERYRGKNLKLDMSRGKPGPDQLDLTLGLLDCVNARDGYLTGDGIDTRNYGNLDGIPEAKALFADMLGMDESQVVVGGNSSLSMMFDFISMACSHGILGNEPWSKQNGAKFLCPSPGYDRHFAITEYFGIDMIPVDMTPEGPDMEQVERFAADPLVKGIWCVPIYSNPDGVTYSDGTVRRLATLKTAAPDFVIMWDKAYCIHHLTDNADRLADLYKAAESCGNQNRVVTFVSTSKISFPGAGVAAVGAGPELIGQIKSRMFFQTIGHDKINMLRHVRFFKDYRGICEHMKLHASVLRPKFEIVLKTLEDNLGGKGIAEWSNPKGGYFISVNLLDGCAAKTVDMLKQAGVVMTPAGATFPYKKDPRDRNIRIAPTYPSIEELRTATELFCICAEIVCLKRQLSY